MTFCGGEGHRRRCWQGHGLGTGTDQDPTLGSPPPSVALQGRELISLTRVPQSERRTPLLGLQWGFCDKGTSPTK